MDIFITGTDTDVGKTVVTSCIAAIAKNSGYTVGIYKPVQTGVIKSNQESLSPDLEFVKSINSEIITKCSYMLELPAAPALAAEMENIEIKPEKFIQDYQELKNTCDIVIVEGAGGLLVPVYKDFLMRDLIKLLNLPLVIVARPDLGTINHTLLTIEAAKSHNINVLGIVISNYPQETDDPVIKTAPEAISQLSGIDILGILPTIKDFKIFNTM